MTVIPLPPGYQYGKVVHRALYGIADTPSDVDALPEARAAQGSATFTPAQAVRTVTDAGHEAEVLHAAVTAQYNNQGRLVDASGRDGIWLATGVWSVTFTLTAPAGMALAPRLPARTIEVTTAHTADNPLNLATAAPYVAPPGATVQTLPVPLGWTPGDFLVGGTTGALAWARPTSVQGLAFVNHGGNANVARPDAVMVIWNGTVKPNNMTAGADLWNDPTLIEGA